MIGLWNAVISRESMCCEQVHSRHFSPDLSWYQQPYPYIPHCQRGTSCSRRRTVPVQKCLCHQPTIACGCNLAISIQEGNLWWSHQPPHVYIWINWVNSCYQPTIACGCHLAISIQGVNLWWSHQLPHVYIWIDWVNRKFKSQIESNRGIIDFWHFQLC